jgi:hypothetical protein
VTLTAGGNDLPCGDLARAILRRLHEIVPRIKPLDARVVVNTIYDPSDGDNDVGRRELGLSRLAAIELRRRLNAVNRGIAGWPSSAASYSPTSSGSSTGTASHRTTLGSFR